VKRYGDLSAIYLAEGATPSFVAKAVEDAGEAGKVLVVAHDLMDETMEFVAKGVIQATISQDPYAQGHDPLIHLFNARAAGWSPTIPRILTHLEVVTPENYARFWNPSGLATQDRSRLAAPLPPSSNVKPENIRIAFLGPKGEGFWKPLCEGAMDAKRELQALGATVELIVPKISADGYRSVSTYAPEIQRLLDERWDGIALPAFDRGFVPSINKAVRAGVPVATYNTEPTSLREMVTAVSAHAESLVALSQELAASANESGQATSRIGDTIQRITASIGSEVNRVELRPNPKGKAGGWPSRSSLRQPYQRSYSISVALLSTKGKSKARWE
jgi:methyl-accepting chemotaxis protein